MSAKVSSIGRCIGCKSFTKLDAGVCEECLNLPNRGRKWAHMSNECRTNPNFALKVYQNLQHEGAKKMFIAAYGLPEGAEPPNVSLHLVKC